MTINNIWVFAQANGDVPTTGSLELLAKARSIGASVTAFVGGDATAIAGALGEHGASKVYATGDLAGKLSGPAVSAAMKAVIDGGDTKRDYVSAKLRRSRHHVALVGQARSNGAHQQHRHCGVCRRRDCNNTNFWW